MDSKPWLTLALKYLGQHEIAGTKDNQFILDCFKHTGYHAGHDEVPWCAAFICRMLEDTGYRSTKSAAASSYLHYGEASEPKAGAIAVFKWPGAHVEASHVSLVHHVLDSGHLVCLGGNQSNQVKYSVYPKSSMKACRWPVK